MLPPNRLNIFKGPNDLPLQGSPPRGLASSEEQVLCHRDKLPCLRGRCPMWIEGEPGEESGCAEADEVNQRARFFGEMADLTEKLRKQAPSLLFNLIQSGSLPFDLDKLREDPAKAEDA